jgi:hypothetical protein
MGGPYRRADADVHRTEDSGDVQTSNSALRLSSAVRVMLLLNLPNSTSHDNRFTPSHSYVRQICYRFTRTLCELPASGDEYSGLHPAWCFLIACACTDDSVEYEKMYEILEYIGGVNKSVRFSSQLQMQTLLILQNVLSLTRLVSWMWEWKNGRDLSAGWWEEMTEYLDSKMGGKLICVT